MASQRSERRRSQAQLGLRFRRPTLPTTPEHGSGIQFIHKAEYLTAAAIAAAAAGRAFYSAEFTGNENYAQRLKSWRFFLY